MKALLVFAAIVSAISLLAFSSPASVRAQGAGVCPTNPDPVDAADPSVIVDTPEDGDRVTSPVTISGQARVFEANVRITIFDAGGNVLADSFTTAAEGAPALAAYSTQVSFTTATEQAGCIRVFEESAQDGSPVNVVQVEVTLAPATTPPKAGSAGLQDRPERKTDLGFYLVGAVALTAGVVLALKHRLWT